MYKVETIVTGVLQENCYIFADDKSKEAVIIDPGDYANIIEKSIESRHYKPLMIINTHYHFDHIGANSRLKDRYDIPIAISHKDARDLPDSHKDAINLMINCEQSYEADILLKENDNISVGEYGLVVMETPGHTKGSICLYEKEIKIVFTGDTLFFESIGRYDLRGGDRGEILQSIKRLLTLDKKTVVYPGHGKVTTIEHELNFNPYV